MHKWIFLRFYVNPNKMKEKIKDRSCLGKPLNLLGIPIRGFVLRFVFSENICPVFLCSCGVHSILTLYCPAWLKLQGIKLVIGKLGLKQPLAFSRNVNWYRLLLKTWFIQAFKDVCCQEWRPYSCSVKVAD